MIEAAFDTEDNGKAECFLICVYSETDGYRDFYNDTLTDAIEYLAKFDIVWATNADYDLTNVFGMMHPLLERVYVDSRLLYGKLGKTEFRDTGNLSNPPMSVAKMGEIIGLPKLEMPKRAWSKRTIDEWITYCRRDTIISYNWVQRQKKEFTDIGVELRRTLPSTALKAFQKMYGKKFFYTPYREVLRKAYAGGRTEIFRMGEIRGPVHQADINSMYPAVMKDNLYPVPDTAITSRRLELEAEGVAYAHIEMPAVNIPPLFVRHDNHTVFPVGSLVGIWTLPELRETVRIGGKVKVIKAIYYTSNTKPFTKFVGHFWKLRTEGYKAAKFVMNSLYGKFAEAGSLTSVIAGERKELNTHVTHANVIWSAYVTAYARISLWQYLLDATNAGRQILYCDTDSCFYTGDIMQEWHSDKLGEMKHVGTEMGFEARLPKVYRWGSRYRAKGVPFGQAMNFFCNGLAEYDKPLRYREAARRGLVANEWTTVRKIMSATYTKRVVLPDGSTEPLSLNMSGDK